MNFKLFDVHNIDTFAKKFKKIGQLLYERFIQRTVQTNATTKRGYFTVVPKSSCGGSNGIYDPFR